MKYIIYHKKVIEKKDNVALGIKSYVNDYKCPQFMRAIMNEMQLR